MLSEKQTNMAEYMAARQRGRSEAAMRRIENKIAAHRLTPETLEGNFASLERRDRNVETYRRLKVQVASAIDADSSPSSRPGSAIRANNSPPSRPDMLLSAQPSYSVRREMERRERLRWSMVPYEPITPPPRPARDPWQTGSQPAGSPPSTRMESGRHGPWDLEKELGLSPREPGEDDREYSARLHAEAIEERRARKREEEAKAKER